MERCLGWSCLEPDATQFIDLQFGGPESEIPNGAAGLALEDS